MNYPVLEASAHDLGQIVDRELCLSDVNHAGRAVKGEIQNTCALSADQAEVVFELRYGIAR